MRLRLGVVLSFIISNALLLFRWLSINKTIKTRNYDIFCLVVAQIQTYTRMESKSIRNRCFVISFYAYHLINYPPGDTKMLDIS